MTLHELGLKHKTDKSDHNYLMWYEHFFGHLRNAPVRLLEIGVQKGHSIEMWLEYFSKPNMIYGVDINDCPSPRDNRYIFTKGDQSKPELWKKFVTDNGGQLDVVIDDGSHKPDGIITTFEALWPHVVSHGFYAIEDLYCAYRNAYQVTGWITQMEFVKGLLDEINYGTLGISRLHFSHELVVVQKG